MGAKLLKAKEMERTRYMFFCPGCKCHHQFWCQFDRKKEPNWRFNGDMEKPTVTPSIRVTSTQMCHFYITNGELNFLNDCTHDLAGTTVPMEDV